MNQAPTKIDYQQSTALLRIEWPDGKQAELSAEFLRVHSPSAEVRGHGIGQETLQTGKKNVEISKIEATGRYAIKITFSDGHDTGLYDWGYLKKLCDEKDKYWQTYLEKLSKAKESRESKFIDITQLNS
ncbi:DUF971 domain-containing protein [Reinekea marina]|uniref:Gamma-butyrobetaine hydroxylase-like domain-containing protein n=1 Tax=Reinekea marina TaxID=1310421 RepID=A0ABV7WQ31_9GAMM|nr:DUF971 domain-containing protein [Reinekea marina]MBU2863475.1 DUF971 domain-containing protein [Reinekea forsetii]MDN3650641.1 DUF971 domain-containing protein [Reinekea marina]